MIVVKSEMHGKISADIHVAKYRARVHCRLICDVPSEPKSEQELSTVICVTTRLERIELSCRQPTRVNYQISCRPIVVCRSDS
jgi:hypothetical protein